MVKLLQYNLKTRSILINHYMLFVSTPLKAVVIIHRGDVLRVMYVSLALFFFYFFYFSPLNLSIRKV